MATPECVEVRRALPAEEVVLFRKLVGYYLPFDSGLSFRLPWIWERATQYAYRNAIAGAALAGISLSADAYGLPLAATATHVLTLFNVFLATVFTAAAVDPRFR